MRTRALLAVAMACVCVGLWVLSYALAADGNSVAHRGLARYRARVDHALYRMFVFRSSDGIVYAQLAALVILALAAPFRVAPPAVLCAVAAVVAGGPVFWLRIALRKRLERIDRQVEGFLVGTANALKSRPAMGDALVSVLDMTPQPLRQELEIATKQIRLGSSVDQALLHMTGRVGSKLLDTAVSAMLVGRQVGGDVPAILDATAASMRESARLEGVVRTKTAEGKAQTWVLALMPLAILVGFSAVSPGYFDPLGASAAGIVVTVIAFALWGGSVALARQILKVE